VASTTHIEIDSQLLEQLQVRNPGKGDRELIEDIARIQLGFVLMRESQERNALSDEEAIELGVRAVRDARRAAR